MSILSCSFSLTSCHWFRSPRHQGLNSSTNASPTFSLYPTFIPLSSISMPSSPISPPHSFVTSLIHQLSTLSTPPPPPAPSSNHTASFNPNLPSSSPFSPRPQPFFTLVSSLPTQKQESITHILTTLHFLFPHEFIPALDLLDRGLVTRMVIRPLSTESGMTVAQRWILTSITNAHHTV